MKTRSVFFRGEQRDVVIDVDGGFEPDTNARHIEWHFEGMSADEHAALNLTWEEEQDIYRQITEE